MQLVRVCPAAIIGDHRHRVKQGRQIIQSHLLSQLMRQPAADRSRVGIAVIERKRALLRDNQPSPEPGRRTEERRGLDAELEAKAMPAGQATRQASSAGD